MKIRPIKNEDIPAVLAIYTPYIEETAFSFETKAPTLDAFRDRVLQYTQKYPWLVAQMDERVIGYAYASKHRDREAYQWCVESSVYLDLQFQGKGIGTLLYNTLFDLLKKQGFVNIYAGITQPNEKSNRLHTAVGFEPVGIYKNIGYKFGRWHDVLWMVKVINEHRAVMETPRFSLER